MMKSTRKLITTLMAASVLGGTVTGVALVGGGTALAAGRGNVVAPRTASAPHDRTLGLNQMVNNGTITRAQANAIETAMIARMRADGSSTSLTRMGLSRQQGLKFMNAVLSQLVTNGTISQAQAEAVTDSVTLRGMMVYGQTSGYGMMDNGYGNGSTSGDYGMMGGF
jgi:translation initiation factor 6 (eIF-6)